VNALHNFFELDSVAILLHNEITSHTSSAAGPAKPMFACELCCPQRKSPDLVALHRNLSIASRRTFFAPTPEVCSQISDLVSNQAQEIP